MKLHLPVALLAAVLSTFAYGAQPVRETGDDGKVTTTLNTNARNDKLVEGSSKTGYLDPLGGKGSASSSEINIEKGGSVAYVTASGAVKSYVTGDKTVNVYGVADNIYAGYIDQSSIAGAYGQLSPSPYNTAFGPQAQPDEQGEYPSININVYEGATVGSIYGTSWVAQARPNSHLAGLIGTGMSKEEAQQHVLWESNPLALKEAVNINVEGGVVGGIYGGVLGGAIDNTVTITVNGDNASVGEIYGGSYNRATSNGTYVGYVESSHIVLNKGTVGAIYGGSPLGQGLSVVKEGTLIELNGGTVTGNVYGAGIGDTVEGGTHVVISGDGTNVTGKISGQGVNSTVVGNRLLTIDHSGGKNVNWDKIEGFNALEIKSSEIYLGTEESGYTLNSEFEKVSVDDSHIQGTIKDPILFEANDSWIQLGGNLTTTAGSYITNTKADYPMSVGGTATFNGTTIGNSTINATENVMVGDGSKVTGSTLNAANGSLAVSNATVTDSTLTGATYGAIVGSTVSGSSVAAQELVVNTSAKITDSTLTADNALIIEGSTVSGSSATSTNLFVQNGAEITDSTLTADKNVFITNGSAVSGSSVTSNTAGISVAGSTLTNADLYAREGKVTITDSSYTNSSGANYIVGGSVSIEDTTITSTKDTLFIKGDTTIANGDFSLSGGSVYFCDDVKADKDSSFVVNKGVLTFGDNADDVVTLNGSAVENNGGTIHAYGKIDANNASISATAGATHFHNVVEATGTSISAQGGAAMHFDKKVVLDGSKVTTLIDSSNSQGVIKFHGDVVASNTLFDIAGGSGLTFEGNVELNGGNTMQVQDGLNRSFTFNGDKVTVNGDNTISGSVLIDKDTYVTAQSGTLNILANNGWYSSRLSNLQQAEGAVINVQADRGFLYMQGTSTINNLSLNKTTSEISGSLTAAQLVSTSDTITNKGTLKVTGATVLTDTYFVNDNKGTTTLKGDVTTTNSDLVSKSGEINLSGAVVSKDSTYYAHGGNINFRNEGNTLTANGGSVVVDKGVVRFGGQYNHNGLVTSNGATFEAIKNSYSDNSVMYFHSAVDANDDTEISALGGTMYFERELDVEGSTITSGKSDAGISGKIYLKDDVVAKDTQFIIDGGSDIEFEGNVELKGDNTLAVVDGNSKYFSFAGEKVTVNGDNTISGGLKMGKDTVLTAESGVLTIESAPKIKEGGSYNPQNLRLNNLQIAENAAVGTEINVTANRGQLSIGGDSTVTNLSIDRATTELSGNLNVGSMEIHSTRNEYGVVGTVDFKGAEGTETNIGNLVFNAKTTDAEITHSGDGTVNIGKIWNMSMNSASMAYELKQTGNGELNLDADYWVSPPERAKITQTGKGDININVRSVSVGFESVTQSGGGTVTVDCFNASGHLSPQIDSLDISNGSTFEAMCTVYLDEVAVSDATLLNGGSMVIEKSLEMDNATLLFAASSLTSTDAFLNFKGADVTGYGQENVSAEDMINGFGIVLSGAAVDTLMQKWETAVEFSFTLADGTDLFEEHFAYILKENLDEFEITLGDVDMEQYELTVDNVKVVKDENGVHITGTVAIPEPTTATLSLLALAALAARRRRK